MSRPNPRKANGHRRREVTKQVLAEEDHCKWCGRAVDKTLTTTPDGKPHPLRWVVDEWIPISRNGSPYDRENCHLMHFRCNQQKSNRMPGTERTPDQMRLPVSRAW